MSLKLDFNIVPICIKELAHLLQLSNLNLEIPSIFPKKIKSFFRNITEIIFYNHQDKTINFTIKPYIYNIKKNSSKNTRQNIKKQ